MPARSVAGERLGVGGQALSRYQQWLQGRELQGRVGFNSACNCCCRCCSLHTLTPCALLRAQGVREDCADIATGLLSMYPLLLDTADFMDVIADAGVRVPASQPAATHYVAS